MAFQELVSFEDEAVNFIWEEAGPGWCSEDPVHGGDAGDLQQPGVLG
jgi:hypothetical protein